MKEFIIALFLGAFLTRIYIYFTYMRILKIAYGATNSNHELVKQLKLRYTNCNTLNIPIVNVGAFIKKHILINCGFKFTLPIVDMIGYGMFFLAIGLEYAFLNNIRYIIIILFILIENAIHREEKLDMAVTLFTDYLENVLSHRNVARKEKVREREKFININVEKEDIKTEDKTAEKDMIAKGNSISGNAPDIRQENGNTLGKLLDSAIDINHAERIINDVLKEFLV